MRAIIADDEERGRMVLRHMLEKHTDVVVVGEAGDGITAMQMISDLRPEVVFLDIRMPGMDGLEVARLIREEELPLQLVFITAYGDHALEAFDLEASDYLVKPLRPDRVKETVRRLTERAAAPAGGSDLAALVSQMGPAFERKIPMEAAGEARRTVYVEESRLRFVEAQGHKTRVVLAGGESLEVNTPLGEMEKWLSPKLFFRSHRGFIVNLAAVQEVAVQGRMYLLRLKGLQETVPLSRDRMEDFNLAMISFQRG